MALWGLLLLAAAGGQFAGAPEPAVTGQRPDTVGVLSPASDAAIIPARIADEVRSGGSAVTLRILAVAAVLAALVGLPAALRRRAALPGLDHQPLRSRRHTIALRAPPLQFA